VRLDNADKRAIADGADIVSLGAIATQPAAYIAVLIPGAGVFVAGGLVLVGAVLGVRAVQQNRLARDPPRDDFDQATTLGPPSFSPKVIGGTPFEEVAIEFVRVQDELAQLLAAAVTALERASGAELADNQVLLAARTAEALHFAEALSSQLEASSPTTDDLRAGLRAALSEHPEPNEIPDFPRNLSTSLGEDLATQLRAMGVPGRDLAGLAGPVADDPIGYLDDALGQLGAADYELGRCLEKSLRQGTLLAPGTELGI
jgi:hypothetical protein